MRATFLEEMIQCSCAANSFVDKDTLRAETFAKKKDKKVQFDGKSRVIPSAFPEMRAERELAKRQKHQSYEDFTPISTSELDRALFIVNIDSISPAQVTPSKCQIEDLGEREVSEDMLFHIRQGNGDGSHNLQFLMVCEKISTIEGVSGRAGRTKIR